MKFKHILYLLFVTFLFSSCEDVIDLELDSGRDRLVVDAFLNSDSTVQIIKLTTTAPYFSDVATPSEDDATIRVVGPRNTLYNFVNDGNGNYFYDPSDSGPLDSIGYSYKLELEYKGVTYTASSTLNPVPVIDSMTYAFEPSTFSSEEGFYSQFFARDFPGRKDFYWIKPFKNGEPVYKEDPAFMILSEDAAFGGDAGDGLVFILPLRSVITDDDNPFVVGDVSSVELQSINSEVFEFLSQVAATSGNDGLFAVPPSNIRSNIRDAAGSAQDEVLGVFSLSAISKFEIIIQ